MDKFDRFLACIDAKIAELDAELKSLHDQRQFLMAMRIKADTFKCMGEDEECPSWP